MPTFSRIYTLANNAGAEVKYSTDYGSSWISVNVPTDTFLLDIAVNPYNPMSVLIAGTNGIHISQDGGNTWNLATGSYSTTATGANFKRIQFIDGFTVFAISDTNLIQSTDGGLTFGVVTLTNDLYPGQSGESLFFANASLGVISIFDRYFVTLDGGATWTTGNSGSSLVSGETIFSVCATSDFSSILATTTSQVWVSTDGGVTNTAYLTFSGSTGYQNYLHRYDNDNIYLLTGYNAGVYKTIDQGLSWSGNTGLFPVSSISDAIKFIVLDSTLAFFTPNQSNVYASYDDGTSLSPIYPGKYISITGINFVCGTCPEGFTLVDGVCQSFEYSDPTYTGTLLEVNDGFTNGSYCKYGLNLMPDITTLVLPIKGYGTDPSNYSFKENNGTGLVVNGLSGYSPSAYNLLSPVNSNLWGTNLPGCSTGSAGGRLNLTSVWAAGTPPNEEVSFTFCITLEQSKQYLIGLAGDNRVKFYVDDNLYVDIDAQSGLVTTPFNYWHVFPITLSAGNHIIKLSGIDFGGAAAGFGAEIYDLDVATFQSLLCTPASVTPNCGNTPSDLEPYIIFSTKDLPGTHGIPGQTFVPDPSDPGEYVCADGSTITFCSGTAKCETPVYAPYFPCCFKLNDCQEVQEPLYTNTPLDVYLGKIIQIAEFPDTCWQLEVTESYCFEPITATVIKEFVDCLSCIPSYKLYNCQDLDEVLYTTQADFEEYTNPSQTVTLVEYPEKCWIVGINYDEVYTPEALTVVTAYESCDTCIPVYYKLTNCADETLIYANPQQVLLQNNNLVVKIDIDSVPTCYSVEKLTGWYAPLEDVTVVSGGYADCTCCIPVPTPEVIPFVRTIPKPVKQFYRVTDSECEITTNVKFANNYYKLFNSIKNGMGNCCDGIDLDKLWIEKELSDYSRINSPEDCSIVTPITAIDDCPIAVIVTCAPPEDVSATGNLT